jgi:co-chaperonin GroES (HSP10)
MSFAPLQAGVLVRRIDVEADASDGLSISHSARKTPQESGIITVGEGPVSGSGELVSTSGRRSGRVALRIEPCLGGAEMMITHEGDVLGAMA